jgi:hypothetical protein
MAETKPAPKKGKGKVYLGLKPWEWAAALAGAVVAYIIYKRMSASSAANSLNAQTAGPGNGAGNIGGSSGSSGSSSSTPTFTDLASWEQAALSAMSSSTLKPADALNSITSWLSGGCVDQAAYNALGNAITTLGIPPGFGYGVPTLSVCPTHAKKAPVKHHHHHKAPAGGGVSPGGGGSPGISLTEVPTGGGWSSLIQKVAGGTVTQTISPSGQLSAPMANPAGGGMPASGSQYTNNSLGSVWLPGYGYVMAGQTVKVP